MDIFDSLEVRWFIGARAPATSKLESFFAGTAPEGQRVDYYLRTGRDDLGIKARVVENQPARVETKYRLGALRGIDLSPGVTGNLERWRKLSLEASPPALLKDGAWLAIEKARRLRKFTFDGGEVREVRADARPEAGCGVELTELRYENGGFARTLGLEAFGASGALLEILRATLGATVAGLALELEESSSMGYAEWLCRAD